MLETQFEVISSGKSRAEGLDVFDLQPSADIRHPGHPMGSSEDQQISQVRTPDKMLLNTIRLTDSYLAYSFVLLHNKLSSRVLAKATLT